MGRPRKAGKLRMDVDIRIPLTRDQKKAIVAATREHPEGMAAWARAILLQAAETAARKAKGDEENRC